MFALSQQDAQASNTVVAGTVIINSHKAHVLFDSGSTHSYISPKFASKLNVMHEKLREPIVVSIPSGGKLEVNKSYKSCIIEVEGRETLGDLLVLDIVDFD